MGNVLADCQRCEVCHAGLDQCELRSDSAPGSHPAALAVPASATDAGSGSHAVSRQASGPAPDVVRRQIPGPAQDVAHRHREFQPDDVPEAELIQQALQLSRIEAGQDTEEELMAAAARKAEMERESRERARLREEQAAEYEESLRIDREREAERALRQKEEEELKQRQAAEAEAQRREAERLRAEAEEAECARRAKAAAAAEAARASLTPEPEPGEPGRVRVLVRTPQGARLERAFRASDAVGQLYHYVDAEGGESLAGSEYRLVSSMPRVVYEERDATLADTGLKGQCMLLVEVIDD